MSGAGLSTMTTVMAFRRRPWCRARDPEHHLGSG
jgi:hypothetical protein